MTPENPIAMVTYTCTIPNIPDINFESIEIASSEHIVGFPHNPTFLNPRLTDEAIKLNIHEDKSKLALPPLALMNKESVKYDSIEEGKFEYNITLEQIPASITKGTTFEIPLSYPSGILLVFTVNEISGKILTLIGEIHGEVKQESLILEQKIITIDGKEAFILPGFCTKQIATKGAKPRKSDIMLSFRQVSGFDKNKLTFNFFGLTMKEIKKGEIITLMIYLITAEGKMDTPTEVTCTTNEDIKIPISNPISQVAYICSIPENKEIALESIEIASSDDISGLPANATLLNP